MCLEEALAIANIAVQRQRGQPLSDLETLIFEGAWQGKTYPQIAEEAGYSINYLTTDVGPKFWKVLSQALGESVNKKNFKAAIRRHGIVEHQAIEKLNATQSVGPTAEAQVQPDSTSVNLPDSFPFTSWGEAPEVSQFYGREAEQEILTRWIVSERCRLIAVLGMGGMGKSTLVTWVAQQFVNAAESPFTHIIWRSLRNAPPLSTLLTELIDFLSDHQETNRQRSRLLHWLRTQRGLIVLDNLETILQAGDQAGYYRPGYEDYGDLLRLLGETRHQSCLVLTSREKPAEVAALAGRDSRTRTLQLSGSAATAIALIQARGLQGTSEQQQTLCTRYSYNPLAIKLVATTIQDLFEGDIGAFLAEEAVIFKSIRRLLETQFQRLSALEQAIMTWLAINRDWTSLGELATDLVPTVPKVRLLEALESLRWRGLIESQQQRYTQQPVVMEYMTEQLVETLSREVTSPALDQWHRYAILKTTVRDFVTESQGRLIVSPLVAVMRDRLPTVAAQMQHLQILLTAIRATSAHGYGAGNLINLSNALDLDLSDFDFSGLTIRQADLRYRFFQRVNFAHAHFHHTAFKQTFGSIFALSYSRDGTNLITGDSLGQLRLWDSVQFQPLRVLPVHTSYVWDIRPSPDGQRVATCSEDQTVQVCDLTTGASQATLSVAPTIARALVWIDAQTLAIGCLDGTIRLWRPGAAIAPHSIAAHTDIVNSLSWHSASGLLASSSNDGTVKLWSLSAGGGYQQAQDFEQMPVRSAAWSPDGQTLACALDSGSLFLWSPRERTLHPLHGHTHSVWSVDWSPGGQVIASASNDATIRLWEAATRRCLRVLHGHQNWVWVARWHPQTAQLASGGHDGSLRLWDSTSGVCLRSCYGHLANVRAIAPTPDGATLALGCDDTILRLWSPNPAAPFAHVNGHNHLIMDLGWSHEGQRLASASHDYTLRIWSRSSQRCLQVLQGHTNWVWSVDWHPHTDLLASGSVDGTVKIWHPEQSQCLQTLKELKSWVLSVRWHPTGQWLAAAAGDCTLYLWHPETWVCTHTLTGHDHWVWRLAWQPGGHLLASASYDNTLKLWHIQPEAANCVQTLPHPGVVSAIAWHPQGTLLATGCHDSIIRLWHSQTGECLAQLKGHHNQILALAFAPTGSHLYSSGEDEMVKMWQMTSRDCCLTTQIDHPYEGMCISHVRGISLAQQLDLEALGAKRDQ